MSRFSEAFEAVRAESKGYNEHNDCTVKAITITTGETYAVCHAALKTEGRKDRKRTSIASMIRASKALGYYMEKMHPHDYNAKTIRTVATDRRLKSGNFIVSTSGHVVAVRDGQVIDHSEGGLRRVQAIFCMTPIAGFTPPPAKPRGKLPAGSAKWQAFSKYTKHDQINLI